MPSWGGILKELASHNRGDAYDLVRRKYLASQHMHSKRAVILYATSWTQANGAPPNATAVDEVDVQGFMEVLHGVDETSLDLILHSPGGSLAAADAIVQYLRSKFSHIRVFVPNAAMSAATMIACAADEVYLGKHSFLGPIDPQITMQTSLGGRQIPAQAILDQFEKAREECANPKNLAVWLPMLQQYGPDLLIQCQHVSELSVELVRNWLCKFMFKDAEGALEKARGLSDWLGSHKEFKMHGRHINREALRSHGMNVVNLESDKTQQDFILSIFHAATHTFTGAGAVKIIENHQGNAFIQTVQKVAIQQSLQMPPQAPTPIFPPVSAPANPPFKKKHSR